MRSLLKRFIVILLALCLLSIIGAIISGCEESVSKEEKLISLYVDSYKSLMSNLSDANLLPQFESAELVEESLGQYLDEDSVNELVKILNDSYPYPISLSRDHERFEGSRNQLPYVERDFAYVYLSPSVSFDRKFVNSNYTKAKMEGFINQSRFNVIMEYTYSMGTWELKKAEVWEVDWKTLTSKVLSK